MLKLFLLYLIAVSLITGCSHVASTSLTTKGMTCIAPKVYVDNQMSARQRKHLLQMVEQSRLQISRFFDGMQSSPAVYACSTQSCFKKFGGISAKAKAIGDDKVLLSPRGLDKMTLSHELSHVELHKRLGSSRVWNRVPMWFDEGLALMACGDARYDAFYSTTSSEVSLSDLVSQRQWVNAVYSHKPAYQVAKQAVQQWYSQVGAQGLQLVISRMKSGGDFSLGAQYPEQQVSHL